MKHADPAAAFHAAAEAALAAENAYRKQAAAEIARLEAARIESFRRIRLVKLLADCSANAESEEAASAAQRAALVSEFGWDTDSEGHRAVLDKLGAPGLAVWRMLKDADTGVVETARSEILAFEHWYQGHAGQSFYRLFDVYRPETPLVDF